MMNTPALVAIQSAIEANDEVILVAKNLGGFADKGTKLVETVTLIVAPTEPTDNTDRLQEYLVSLLPRGYDTTMFPFIDHGGALSLGRFNLEESLAGSKIVIFTTTRYANYEIARLMGLPEGRTSESNVSSYKTSIVRKIWVIMYPSKEVAEQAANNNK